MNLTWHHQINNVAAKLNRANNMLSRIRNFLNLNTLKSINQAIFESHVNYSLPVWVENSTLVKRFLILQKKSLGIMHIH